MWMPLLEFNGISVTPIDEDHVHLQYRDHSADYVVVVSRTRMHPSQVPPAPRHPGILVAPALSEAAAEIARSQGWSAIPDSGPAWVRFRGTVVELERPTTGQRPTRTRGRGRPGWGTFSVMRALLAMPDGARQKEISALVNLTQPRVSQALNDLSDDGLVVRGDSGWAIRDKATAIDWWIQRYPGPGGLESHWFGLGSIAQQAHRAYDFLADAKARPAVSGDVAVDLIEPWRSPQHALLYAASGKDLSEVGFTPVARPESTLTIILPADRAVWPLTGRPWMWELSGNGTVARAGALQILYDLSLASGPDSQEACQAWRSWVLKQDEVL